MSGSIPPLAELLRTHRVRAGLSQEALAEASGVSVRTISDLERGQRSSAHLETVRLLAEALNLTDDRRLQFMETLHTVRSTAPTGVDSWTNASALPIPITSLVGRTRELDDLDKLLRMRSGAIVTLTGTGGVGKTRLAVEAAHQLAPGFADGTAFVGLATVPQAELVPFAIARAFDAATTEQLMAMLATRELLLVLDNLEHVVDAAPFVAQLDAACPNLTILATSRVPLRISNERVVSIQPLSVAESNAPLDEVRSSGAGQLFAERARQIDPQFALSEQNASVVNAICQRLEGIPLAIGLAASRLRVLTVPAMLDRLDRRLPMLTGGAHDLHPRQHSMRQTIAWSYDLLDPAAQRALRWMSVFVGGVSLESVDAVGRALGHDADASLELVTTLLEAGMLYRIGTADDEPRFQLFETIREFGLDRLDVDGELQTARQFYANHFLGLVLHAFKVPYQPVDPVWLGQVESEHHNLVQAFDILNQPETVELAVQFAAPMAWIWRTRGPFSEGQARILRVIGLAPAEPSLAKADMLISATYFIGLMDTPSLSYQIAHSAVEVAEQTGSELYRATARQALAFVEEYNLQFDRARSIYDEILPIWEREENEIMQAICLMLLGGIEYASGNLDRAYANEQRAVELFLRVGDLRNAAVSTWYQGMFAIAQGRMDHAAEMCDRALRMWLEADTERMWFKAFASLADVAAAIGLFESSAHFLGATDQMLRELGAELMPFDKPGYDRASTATLAALGADRFATLKDEGSRLTQVDLLAESSAIVEAARAFGHEAGPESVSEIGNGIR